MFPMTTARGVREITLLPKSFHTGFAWVGLLQTVLTCKKGFTQDGEWQHTRACTQASVL